MATGDTLLVFTPLHHEPVTADSATIDLRNSHPVLDFDASTNESTVFSSVMPQSYSAATGVTVKIHYAMTSGITGDIDWDVSWERIGDDVLDIDADSFAAVNSVDNTTVNGTSGNLDVVSVTFTAGADMDSVVKGDAFRIKVTRDAAADTATGDAELLRLELQDT